MKTLTPITQFEITLINRYIESINKEAKCKFISVDFKKLGGEMNAVFKIYGEIKCFEHEETAIAFLDGIYIWATTEE